MLGLIRKFAQWPWPLLRSSDGIVPNIWALFRFENGEAINEVNDIPATLIGATVSNGKLVTGNSVSTDMQFPAILFGANEDFTIEGECTINAPASHADILMSSWTAVSDAGSHWSICRIVSSGKWQFWFNDALRLASANTFGIGSYHVAVTRKSGVMRLYVNGVLEATATYAAGNTQNSSTAPIRLRVNSTVQFINGTRDNLRIAKECLYPEAGFTPATVYEQYKRAQYSEKTSADIMAQYCFRRNQLTDEANTERSVTLSGTAAMQSGRITTTNANTSRYSFPCDYFGEGDFTIEFMCNVSAVSGTQVMLLGQYFRGAANIDPDDSWNIQWNSSDGIQFIYYDGAEKKGVGLSANAAPKNKDCHVAVVRYDGVLYLYVDGVKTSQREFSAALRKPVTNTVTSFYKDSTITTLFGARSIWNIRIAKRALYKDAFPVKPTFPAFPTGFSWFTRQFRFEGNSTLDDVSGHDMYLSHPTSRTIVSEGKLFTDNHSSYKAEFPTFWCDENEDFTLESKLIVKGTGSVGGAVFGVWNSGELTGNSWILIVNSDRTLSFAVATANVGNSYLLMTTSATIEMMAECHVAVVRKGSTITLYLNGVAAATMQYSGPLLKQSLPTSTSWASSSGFLQAWRWDIRIVRGEAKYSGSFSPTPLTPFYRPLYQEAEQSNIVSQVTFRENMLLDEATGDSVSLSGGSIVRGRYVSTAKTQALNYVAPDFTQGDFTIEFKFRVNTALGPTSTATYSLFGRRNSLGADWFFYLAAGTTTNAMTLKCTLYTSTTRSRTATLADCVPANQDMHVVVERLDGVVSIYVDGVLKTSFTESLPLLFTQGRPISTFAAADVSAPSEKQVWGIRLASKSLYKGKVPYRTAFPRLTKSFAVQSQNVSVQALEKAEFNNELSDHSAQNITIQVMEKENVQDKMVLSDHNAQTLIVQVMEKL